MTSASPDRVVILNGSPSGAAGNTWAAVERLLPHLAPLYADCIQLAEVGDPAPLKPALARAGGFLFATGTYWDSWGSPLQRFFETATELEGSEIWFGKPAAVLVTMHSVGGKGVLSRLQGVLCSLGLEIPPMTGMVYSFANHLALAGGAQTSGVEADLWQLNDLAVIAANLRVAMAAPRGGWSSWPLDRGDGRRRWL
jgi:hypothetical protein